MSIFDKISSDDKFSITELYFIEKIINEELSYCESQLKYHSDKRYRKLNREKYDSLEKEKAALIHLKKVIEGKFNGI